MAFLKDYIIFADKDEELQKYILRQHQTGGVEKVVERALDPVRTRGLVRNTQGSGKTFTMIVAAQMLFRAPQADKPTILLMIDRNELEDQMLKNLMALGIGNLEHADSIRRLINLVKAIEKQAEDESDDPFLVAMAERAKAVQEAFEDRQSTTEKALAEHFKELEKNKRRKHEQADKGLDGLRKCHATSRRTRWNLAVALLRSNGEF